MVGGDHALTYFALAGIAAHTKSFTFIQFDAHSDIAFRDKRSVALTDRPLNHANFVNSALRVRGLRRIVQVGLRPSQLRRGGQFTVKGIEVTQIDAPTLEQCPEALCKALEPALHAPVYISIDVDVMDPSEAPLVTTPLPNGITAARLLASVKEVIRRAPRVIGLDIVELCGQQSVNGVNLAAHHAYRCIEAIGTHWSRGRC
jgi:agmatinase